MIISHVLSLYSSFVTKVFSLKKYITDNSYTPGIPVCTIYRFSLYLIHYKYMPLYIHIQKLTFIDS